jgi:hypothetical protein
MAILSSSRKSITTLVTRNTADIADLGVGILNAFELR